MKSIIKSMTPEKLMPVARKINSVLFSSSPKLYYPSDNFNDITALKCIVAYNKYGGYCVPRSSYYRPASQKIISGDVYEPETIEFIRANCENGDVVHAGTYFGDFLPAISTGSAQDAKVWAFEPNPESFRCAKITLEINDINNVVLTNAGLGEKKDTMFIQTTDEKGASLGGGSQIISDASHTLENVVSVQILAIDDVVPPDRNVTIIQLDVEGHEQAALTGALKTIARCLPVIILEVLPDSTLLDSKWFSENILKMGYKKINDIHGNSIFSCEK